MANYQLLKADIDAKVYQNGKQEITGENLNSVLNAMVASLGAGYQFMGMATPTNPGTAQTPDYKCFYLATTPGTYTYLGGLVVADGEVAFLKYGTSWTKEVTGIASVDQLNQLGKYIENPEWLKVTTDSEGKILEGINSNGEKEINVPLKKLNLTEDGMNILVNDLEEHGISGGGVTQEELDQQLSNYVQNTTLGAYETKQELSQTLEGYVKDTDSVSNIANGAVTVPTLSQAVQDLISAGGSGTITNNPDDVTLETNGNNQIQIKEPYKIRGAQGSGGNANGDARATCATDFQLERTDPSQVAGGDYSFIAGGRNNKIYSDVRMGQKATECHAEGKNNIANSWQAHVEGSRCISDAKIGHAEGNASICSTNDGHAEGNRTVAGRVRFNVSSYGTEDAGGNLGILNYVVIPASNGDVTAYFPNALITDAYVTQHYGSTSQKDSQGNIYNSPFTPAVWDGDTLVTKNDLTWALHNVCIVRGQGESDICYARIKKAVYDSLTGTKIYFVPDDVYAVYSAIYSSYAPQVQIDGFRLGNGGHSEGYITQCAGYGAHSEGYMTKANGDGSHAEGASTQAIATSTHAEGELTIASKLGAHAQGIKTTASGRGAFSMGAGSVASRAYQMAYSAHEVEEDRGKRQTCEIMYDNIYVNHGWHTIPLIKQAENNKTYCIEAVLLGRQIEGESGTIGDTFAYKVTMLASVSEGTMTLINSTVTLIGRSSGMSGDGISTGVRITSYSSLYDNNIIARLDSIDGATFRVTSNTEWVEITNE